MGNPESTRQYLDRRYESLKSLLNPVLAQWRDIADYVLPTSPRWFTQDRDKHGRRNQKIVNDCATNAARTLAGGFQGGLTSAARAWFQLRTTDPFLNDQKAIKVWLDDVRKIMLDTFQKSNLYQVLPTLYEEIGVFATGAFALMEDEESVIRCYSCPLGSYVLGQSERGTINTFGREYQMSHRQLVHKFGFENCSLTIQAAYQENRPEDIWVDVRHFVEPNPDYIQGHPHNKRKKFRSVYYERGNTENKLLSESGFDEFPIMVARWGVTGEDTFGNRCPGMQALGNVKTLQLGEKRGWEAFDKAIRPALSVPDSLNGTTVEQIPGGITYRPRGETSKIEPIHVANPYIAEFEAKLGRLERQIERAFFVDLFSLISNLEGTGHTATEINELRNEKMVLLGPVLEWLNEMFDLIIKRTFSILADRGMIPEPPPEMTAPLAIEYISILAQAQKLIGISALERLTAFIMGIIPVEQSAGDKYDFDQAIDDYAAMVGAGPRTIRDAKEVAAIRQQRSQDQANQQNMAMVQQGADAVNKLGNAPITDDAALGAMMSRNFGGGIA